MEDSNGRPMAVKTVKVKKSRVATWLMLLILVAAAGVGAYFWRDMNAKSDRKDDQAKIANLQTQVDTLKASPAGTADTTADTKTTLPTDAVKQSIKESITSGNTAALEGYMASTVRVIVAASEGIGDRTPVQSISDLKYIDAATTPWNFSLDGATLAKYGSGEYKAYFSSNSVVGKSANNFVISFNFNSTGKINGIFMTNNADLL